MPIHKPLHPGAILKEILIEGAGLTVTNAAQKLHIDRTTLSRLLNEHAILSNSSSANFSTLFPVTLITGNNLLYPEREITAIYLDQA